jgi:prephenate dehydrogenase
MTVKITIIGMGQVGTSIGLALAAHTDKVERTGHDKFIEQANKARSLGALDRVEFNLPRSVEKADLVILALPMDAIEETLRIIGPDLREDCVVVDTAPFKAPVADWARAHLPPGRHYVGLVPALSPHQITGLERLPHEDLFRDGVVGLVHPYGTPGEAVKLASDLASLLGAQPFFMDISESDNLMASAHLLPQLLGAALLDMTVDFSGWREMRRLAGRPYATATLLAASQDDPAGLAQALLSNPQASLGAIDAYIQTLTALRTAIATGEGAELTRRFEKAQTGRGKWWADRASGDWQKIEIGGRDLPKRRGILGNWFSPEKNK